MKVCVINYSGNVGKSVVAQHLLKPRLDNSEVISVESINDDGTTDEKIKGKRFSEIMNRVLETDNVIVDVGASNVEEFLNQMRKSVGSEEDFDLYVVPTINKNKQITDTVSTIEALNELEIPKEKINILFNMLDDDTECQRDFRSVFLSSENAIISEEIKINENELFNRLHEVEDFKSINELANNSFNYRKAISETDNKQQRSHFANQLGLQRLAKGVNRQLDKTYLLLTKDIS